MTKRSFRHWQKSSKKSISKITKQHIVIRTRILEQKKLADKAYKIGAK
jgi:hypothetical protein